MKPFLLLFTSFFFLVLHAFGQDLLKKWDIPPYSIELYRIEQVQESYGGIDIEAIRNPRPPKKAYYTSYHILKSGQPTTISGHIRTSKDSCQMNFIDLGTTRNLTGILGHDVVLNLCKNTIELKPIEKPNWLSTPIDSAIIKDLQSDSVQRMHPKMNEALRIFTTHEYTVLNNKYIASEWQAPFLPRYQITLFQGKARHEVLLYYDRYIIDNFIYSTGSNQGTSPEDLHFWESNLKLLLRDQLIDKNSTEQH
jgi:hypothetical protein